MAGDRSLFRLLLHVLLVRPLVHLFFGLNVRGRENLPDRGPFILAANHNSHLDILLLFAALPLREQCRTHAVAAKECFAHNSLIFAIVNFLFRPVWVERESRTGDPMREMRERLAAGENVVIFPEGTRGEAGKIGRFHIGAGRLVADQEGVPFLPVFLLGPESAMPRRASLPLPLGKQLTIGPPLVPDGEADEITRALRESVQALARSETAARHRRREERRRPLVVAVLGIDGSGKSTLSRALTRDVAPDERTCLIGDRLELLTGGVPRAAQPFAKERIRRWLSARAKKAKSLARYRIPKLTELMLRNALLGEAKRWYGPDLIVMDGSPLLNITAWSALYRPGELDADLCARGMALLSGRRTSRRDRAALFREYPVLRTIKSLGLARLALPDAVFFVDVGVSVALERIQSRGEHLQLHETEEKLVRLREAYHLVVSTVKEHFGRPAFVLDGARDAESVAAEARRLLAQVRAEGGERTATEVIDE